MTDMKTNDEVDNDPLVPASAAEYRAVYDKHREALTVHASYTHLTGERERREEDRMLTRWGLHNGPAVCESYMRGERWTYRVNPAFLESWRP